MKILVLNQAILAIDPKDTGTAWETTDQIIPKHVAAGAKLVTVPGLPDDYAPGRYTYDGGFVPALAGWQGGATIDSIPASCTRRQGRLALLDQALLDDVESAIASIPDAAERRRAQVEYEADTWERSNPFLVAMWASLGGSESGLDDLFRLAVTL